MNEMNDEAMQEMMENYRKGSGEKKIQLDDGDLKAYSLLFEAIRKEPAIPLRTNFSSKVTARILAEKNRSSDLTIYMLVAAGLLVLVLGACLYLGRMPYRPNFSLLFLVKNKGILVFGAVALLVVQLLDKLLNQPFKVLRNL